MTPNEQTINDWKGIQKSLLNQLHQRMVDTELNSIEVCKKANIPAKRWNDYVTCRKPLLIDDLTKLCSALNFTPKLTFSKL